MKKKLQMLMAPAIAAGLILSSPAAFSQSRAILVNAPNNANTNPPIPTLDVYSNATNPSNQRTDGAYVTVRGGESNFGLFSKAIGGGNYNEGVRGWADSAGVTGVGVMGMSTNAISSNYGVYGQASGGAFNWAGYFVGNVYTTGSYLPSDEKLKRGITAETSMLDKIRALRPVSYYYKSDEMKHMSLPSVLQHGFVSQDLKKVFPEMVTTVEHPVVSLKGIERIEKSEAVNYTALIPVLIKAIQEQQEYIEKLEEKVNQMGGNRLPRIDRPAGGLYLGQNVPNPSGYATEIRYSIPQDAGKASIAVFDLTGKMLLQFNNLTGTDKIEINKSRLAAGSYIYSLIVNGQEAITKRMIISQ